MRTGTIRNSSDRPGPGSAACSSACPATMTMNTRSQLVAMARQPARPISSRREPQAVVVDLTVHGGDGQRDDKEMQAVAGARDLEPALRDVYHVPIRGRRDAHLPHQPETDVRRQRLQRQVEEIPGRQREIEVEDRKRGPLRKPPSARGPDRREHEQRQGQHGTAPAARIEQDQPADAARARPAASHAAGGASGMAASAARPRQMSHTVTASTAQPCV